MEGYDDLCPVFTEFRNRLKRAEDSTFEVMRKIRKGEPPKPGKREMSMEQARAYATRIVATREAIERAKDVILQTTTDDNLEILYEALSRVGIAALGWDQDTH